MFQTLTCGYKANDDGSTESIVFLLKTFLHDGGVLVRLVLVVRLEQIVS